MPVVRTDSHEPPRRAPRLHAAIAAFAAALPIAAVAWWLVADSREPPSLVRPASTAAVEPARDEPAAESTAALSSAPAAAPPTKLPAFEAQIDERPIVTPAVFGAPVDDEADAEPANELLLHVLDRATGAELTDVEVAHAVIPSMYLDYVPSLDVYGYRPIANGSSPLHLERPAEDEAGAERRSRRLVAPTITVLRVGASGYETASIAIDWRSGGERTIELHPGAALEVVVHGGPDDERLVAQLYDAATNAPWRTHAEATAYVRRLSAERALFLDSKGRAQFEGARVGSWRVSVTRETTRDEEVVAMGEVALAAGAAQRIDLDYHRPAPPKLVRVEGVLRFGPEWQTPDAPDLPERICVASFASSMWIRHAALEGKGDELVVSRDGATARFGPLDLPPGRALARLDDIATFEFDVPDQERADVTLDLPPPAHVRVVVRGDDEEPLPGVALQWSVGVGGAAPFWFGGEPRDPTDEEGCAEFVVPSGKLHLFVLHDGSIWGSESEHELRPGQNEFTVYAADLARVEITLREGRARLPPTPRIAGITGLIHPCTIVGFGSRGATAMRLQVDGEGPALLKFTEIDGYAPVAPFRVDLVRGATVRVEVPLRRARH